MWEEILKAIPIYLASMLKVVFGPTLSYASGLHYTTSILVTFGGMMTSVLIITFFGDVLKKGKLKAWFERREQKAQNSKWKKYGLVGLAILTPLLLTPIGGTILSVAGGYPRHRIIIYMLVSAMTFALASTALIYYFGDAMEKFFEQFMFTF
jgi:membrane protein YqaA with SNARE-associated domain